MPYDCPMGQLVPVWGTERQDRMGDIVFVHGLDGDARTTWESQGKTNSFWLEWLGADLKDAADPGIAGAVPCRFDRRFDVDHGSDDLTVARPFTIWH